MCFSSPSMPSQPLPPPPAPPRAAPSIADPSVGKAMDETRRREQARAARAGTVLTSPLGLNDEKDASKTLLTAN